MNIFATLLFMLMSLAMTAQENELPFSAADTADAITCIKKIVEMQVTNDKNLKKGIKFYKEKFVSHPNSKEAHWLYSSLHQEYLNNFQQDSALQLMEKRFAISKALSDSFLLATDYQALGSIYLQSNDFDAAIDAFTTNLLLLKEIKDTAGYFYANLNLGACYFYKNYYNTALDYFEKARKQLSGLSEVVERQMKGILLNNVGTIYSRKGKLNEAIKSFTQISSDTSLAPYPRFLASSNLFVAYLDIADYQAAYKYYQLCLKYMQDYGFTSTQVVLYAVKLSQNYPEAGNPFELLQDARDYYVLNQIKLDPELLLFEAELFFDSGKNRQALDVIQKIFQNADFISNQRAISDAYFLQSKLFKRLNGYEKALDAYQMAINLEYKLDSINDEAIFNDLAVKFELNRLENDLEEERLQIKLKNLQLVSLQRENAFRIITGLLVIVVLSSLVLFLWFNQQRSKILLIQKQQEEAILKLKQKNLEESQRKLQSQLLHKGLELKSLKAKVIALFEAQANTRQFRILQAKIGSLFKSDENLMSEFRNNFFARFPSFEQGLQKETDNALSVRQMNYAILSALGLDIPEIADVLFVSESAVRKHRASIKKKLGLRQEDSLVIYLRKFLSEDV